MSGLPLRLLDTHAQPGAGEAPDPATLCDSYPRLPQHRLYFLPLPQGQGSLRPTVTLACMGRRLSLLTP